MDIIFNGRRTDVLERFRRHATAKLGKVEKLDQRAIRVDVEVIAERNPRQADRKERVELTVRSRGPAIRAEAAAEDRFAALDMAFAKLEARLRKALDRRKCRHGAHAANHVIDLPEASTEPGSALAGPVPGGAPVTGQDAVRDRQSGVRERQDGVVTDGPAGDVPAEEGITAGPEADSVVQIQMEGDGPVVVREKFHPAAPMSIDQALFEMELVGHDFFLFTDKLTKLPSVVYRRRGYQYGVIRLVDQAAGAQWREGPAAPASAEAAALARVGANGQVPAQGLARGRQSAGLPAR